MTGIHIILPFLPRKSVWGRGDILSHSPTMTQWSMAVSCFLSGFHTSAGQKAMRNPKLFSTYCDTAGTQQGAEDQLHQWEDTHSALDMELLMGLLQRLLRRQWPLPIPLSMITALERTQPEQHIFSSLTFSFSHTNLCERQVGNCYCRDK